MTILMPNVRHMVREWKPRFVQRETRYEDIDVGNWKQQSKIPGPGWNTGLSWGFFYFVFGVNTFSLCLNKSLAAM